MIVWAAYIEELTVLCMPESNVFLILQQTYLRTVMT